MMRRVCGAILFGLLAGCSTLLVVSDYAVGVDFTQFRTFQYKDTESTIAGANPLTHRRIVDGLNRHMVESGLVEAESDPDLYVSYYAAMNQEVVVFTTHTGYRWNDHGWRHNHNWNQAVVRSTTTAHTFDHGTMVIDIWDARSKELVWRSTVQDYLHHDPNRVNDQVGAAIAQAFDNFPPSP